MRRFLETLILVLSATSFCYGGGTVISKQPEILNVSWTLKNYSSRKFGFYTEPDFSKELSGDFELGIEITDQEIIGKGTLYFGWQVIEAEENNIGSVSLWISGENLIDNSNTIGWLVNWDYNTASITGSSPEWNNEYSSTPNATNASNKLINSLKPLAKDFKKSSGFLPLNIETHNLIGKVIGNYSGTITFEFTGQ